MRTHRRFAAVSVLALAPALALAACGGPAEDDATPAATEAPVAMDDAAPADETAAADAAGAETPATEASEAAATPTPAPTASASATPTPSATPTRVAAATPAAPATPPAAFTQCGVCHSVQRGQNGIGPSLAGVVGRRAGTASGFTYTDGMRTSGLTWNEATLDRYLGDPAGVVPGTTMAIGPLDAAQRRAVIAYLKTL